MWMKGKANKRKRLLNRKKIYKRQHSEHQASCISSILFEKHWIKKCYSISCNNFTTAFSIIKRNEKLSPHLMSISLYRPHAHSNCIYIFFTSRLVSLNWKCYRKFLYTWKHTSEAETRSGSSFSDKKNDDMWTH